MVKELQSEGRHTLYMPPPSDPFMGDLGDP